MGGGHRQVQHAIDGGIGDERIDVDRTNAGLGRATRGRVRHDVGTGGDLDTAEQRGVAQVGHRDAAATHDPNPQVRSSPRHVPSNLWLARKD